MDVPLPLSVFEEYSKKSDFAQHGQFETQEPFDSVAHRLKKGIGQKTNLLVKLIEFGGGGNRSSLGRSRVSLRGQSLSLTCSLPLALILALLGAREPFDSIAHRFKKKGPAICRSLFFKLVEAVGIEPTSGNAYPFLLHA